MTSTEITIEIMRRCSSRQHRFIIPNFYISGYECDVFSLTRSGRTYEYEIKVSRKDFFDDFKKGKHAMLSDRRRINNFWYVVPEGLVLPSEIPSWAGLFYVTAEGLKEMVKAPLLSKTPYGPHLIEKIADRFFYDNMKLRRQLLDAGVHSKFWTPFMTEL